MYKIETLYSQVDRFDKILVEQRHQLAKESVDPMPNGERFDFREQF